MEKKITMKPHLGKGNIDGKWYNTLTIDVIDSENNEYMETYQKDLEYPMFMPSSATEEEKAKADAYQYSMMIEDYEVKCAIRCLDVYCYGIFTAMLKHRGYTVVETKPIHRSPNPYKFNDVEEIEEYQM